MISVQQERLPHGFQPFDFYTVFLIRFAIASILALSAVSIADLCRLRAPWQDVCKATLFFSVPLASMIMDLYVCCHLYEVFGSLSDIELVVSMSYCIAKLFGNIFL